MPMTILPSGFIVSPPRRFSLEVMEHAIQNLCSSARDFTGFISITSGQNLYLLFFFRSHPYAAGKSVDQKPFSLTIREFFCEIILLADTAAAISIHETDPVLLKSILVFIQDLPAAKAPSSLINLEAMLDQIKLEGTDALVVLEKNAMCNFFYLKDGVRGMSYYADEEFAMHQHLPIDEQMLAYAFQGGEHQIEAMIFRTISTKESVDAALISQEDILRFLRGGTQGESLSTSGEISIAEEVLTEDNLLVTVLEGPLKGRTFAGPIPCVFGRKDADIILADPMISKSHAVIQVVNGKVLLVDLSSTNGTFINGTRIKQHEIGVGDVIGMGSTFFKILEISPP